MLEFLTEFGSGDISKDIHVSLEELKEELSLLPHNGKNIHKIGKEIFLNKKPVSLPANGRRVP